jgi:hypothetical protein
MSTPTVLEQADALTAQAVELLLAERQRIDDRLAQLGQNKTALPKKRGRPKGSTSELAPPCSSEPVLT